MNLKGMKPQELKAAMQGGTELWGVFGSAAEHVRYALALPKVKARGQCPCECGNKATHAKMVNGLSLGRGCELSVRRWVREGGGQ